jgi:hypothetical protein
MAVRKTKTEAEVRKEIMKKEWNVMDQQDYTRLSKKIFHRGR